MKLDKELQREAAKIGMTATLGVTVATSMFMKNKAAKKAHIYAGVAFCGFVLWHTTLYDKKSSVKVKAESNEPTDGMESVEEIELIEEKK